MIVPRVERSRERSVGNTGYGRRRFQGPYARQLRLVERASDVELIEHLNRELKVGRVQGAAESRRAHDDVAPAIEGSGARRSQRAGRGVC
jgi:hypothetical protein